MDELSSLAEGLADRATASLGEQIEAYVARIRETSVRAFEGEIEHLTTAQSHGVGIRVVRDRRQGFAWAADLDADSATAALEEARDNCRFATPHEHAALAEPEATPATRLGLWREELASMPQEDKVELALDLEHRVRRDRRIRKVVRADYGDSLIETAVASSTGISSSSRRGSCHLSVYAIAGEGDDTHTGFGVTAARVPAELESEACAEDAIVRATRLLGATKPPSGSVTVVLDRRVAATFLGIVAGTFSGEEVLKQRSIFAGRLGEEVAPAHLTLFDDPTDAAAFGAAAFDGEGLPTRRNELIRDGRAAGYLYDTRAGRMAGTRSTASAVRGSYRTVPGVGLRAVSVRPGELTQEEILAQVGRGLFVQSVTGVNSGVNTVSGDFSVGAEGLMIRDGALAEPVREVTIASTLQRMLLHLTHIGSDLEWLPRTASGVTLAIEGVSLGGA